MKNAAAEKAPNSVTMPAINPKPSHTKRFSGSNHEQFSLILINQVASTMWTAHSDEKGRQAQIASCLEAMVGISPQDESEGMLAAQMVAIHNAAMECFRRAMIKEQPLAGRQQNLSFANKLTRSYALALETLDKHRGKGQQKVTVEHVHVHQGGQAIVGNVQNGAGAQPKNRGTSRCKSKLPMHLSLRCGAHSRRSGKPCRNGAMNNGRCRMHGGQVYWRSKRQQECLKSMGTIRQRNRRGERR